MDDDADGSVDVTETDGVRAAAFVCGFVVCSVERLMLQHSALCPMYKQVLAWKDTVAFGLLTRDIYLCKATLKKAMYCQMCFTNTSSTTYWFAVYSYTGLSVLQNFYREEEHTLHVVIGFLIFQLWVLNG